MDGVCGTVLQVAAVSYQLFRSIVDIIIKLFLSSVLLLFSWRRRWNKERAGSEQGVLLLKHKADIVIHPFCTGMFGLPAGWVCLHCPSQWDRCATDATQKKITRATVIDSTFSPLDCPLPNMEHFNWVGSVGLRKEKAICGIICGVWRTILSFGPIQKLKVD